MSQCYEKYDLNEKTCKFVKKCPDGKIRNQSFRCVNPPPSAKNTIKRRVQKSKIDAEERLRGRTEILKNLFKSKSNQFLKMDEDKVREKLMRIKTQTVKRGFDDLTQNVNSLLERVESYNGTKRRTRTRKPKSKKERAKSVNFYLNNISNTEDLRNSISKSPKEVEVDLNEPITFNQPNTHLDEQERLESPDSPLKSETQDSNSEKLERYRKAVSGMFDSINMSKLNKRVRTPRTKKPMGTSMNARPRRKRSSA
jgi:hypothetical protein